MHGPEFGQKVLRGLKTHADSKKEIPNKEIIAIVGGAVGTDLGDYFEKTWGIR